MPFPEFCRGSLVGLNLLRVNFSGLTASSPAGAGRGLTPGTEQLCQVLPIKLRTRLRSLNRAALAQQHRIFPGLAFRVFTKPDRTPPKKVQPSAKQRRWPRVWGRGQRRAIGSGGGQDRSPKAARPQAPGQRPPAVVPPCPAHLGGGGILLVSARGHSRGAAAPPAALASG